MESQSILTELFCTLTLAIESNCISYLSFDAVPNGISVHSERIPGQITVDHTEF